MAYKYDHSFAFYDHWDNKLGGVLIPSSFIILLSCLFLPQRKLSPKMLT